MGPVSTNVKSFDEVRRALQQISTMLTGHGMVLSAYGNSNRPAASSVSKYTMIFNTDDNFVNVSDGTNWRDPTGAVT